MSALAKATQLGITGTDAQIATQLQALTAKDVAIPDAAEWLFNNGLWVEIPDGRSGTLFDIYQATQVAKIKTGLAGFFAFIFRGQAKAIRCTQLAPALRMADLTSLIKAQVADGNAIAAEFYAMAGGRPWASVTAQQITDERQALADAEALEAIRAPLRQKATDVWNASINAIDDGTATTVAELKAVVDGVFT